MSLLLGEMISNANCLIKSDDLGCTVPKLLELIGNGLECRLSMMRSLTVEKDAKGEKLSRSLE
jgi:hypothetical protein